MQRASWGFGCQLNRDLCDHGQHALTTDDHRQQIQARCIKCLGPEFHGLTVHHIAANAHHIVQRQSIFEAMHAPGILGHVAADGARDLAAWIRSVVQPVMRRSLADGQVADTALDGGGTSHRIDG